MGTKINKNTPNSEWIEQKHHLDTATGLELSHKPAVCKDEQKRNSALYQIQIHT